jgi:hypothetical protein
LGGGSKDFSPLYHWRKLTAARKRNVKKMKELRKERRKKNKNLKENLSLGKEQDSTTSRPQKHSSSNF